MGAALIAALAGALSGTATIVVLCLGTGCGRSVVPLLGWTNLLLPVQVVIAFALVRLLRRLGLRWLVFVPIALIVSVTAGIGPLLLFVSFVAAVPIDIVNQPPPSLVMFYGAAGLGFGSTYCFLVSEEGATT